ncbi:cysteine-S-conjugate beta-lyase [Pseudoscourfieldia marina]
MNSSGSGSPSSDVLVDMQELRDTALDAIRTIGYSANDAAVLLDVMMYAQMRGNNQGIIKITTNGLARNEDATPMRVEHDTATCARINGNREVGMAVLYRATEMAVQKAKSAGVGIVGTHNTSTSTGALGYYCRQAAKQGVICLAFAQSPEFVAPYGSKEALFGTNPIAAGFPTSDTSSPLVMDLATSAYALFGLLEAKTAGRKIPEGVAQDAAGRVTTDPSEVLDGGAIRVFDGGHKGSSLALLVELLGGALTNAAIEDKKAKKSWGNLVVCIDPKQLGWTADEFQRRVDTVCRRVKKCEPLPDHGEILLPGERGDRVEDANERAGSIKVEANLWKDLQDMAAKAPPRDSADSATAPSSIFAASSGGMPESNGAPSTSRGTGKDSWGMDTRLVHPTDPCDDPYAAVAPPLYQTATFKQPDAVSMGPYDYTRSGNPTRAQLEHHIAELEGGDRGFAFASGMAALTAVTRIVRSGETILAGDDIYGGTSRLLGSVLPKQDINVVHVVMSDLDAVESALNKNKVKLLMLESPTNPRMQVIDLQRISAMAKKANPDTVICVDNSIMAPVYQRPLDLGADVSMTSATKFIAGHSDVTAGLLTTKGKELGDEIYFHQNSEGTAASPFDCWLSIRGIKTMKLRMDKQSDNAMKIARFLEKHPLVSRVHYPGLETHANHDVQRRQASGYGSLLSFNTHDVNASRAICEKSKLFKITVSFGSVSSLISMPCFMSHASIPAEVRAERGLTDDLVRISAGIEDAEDLIADLKEVMDEYLMETTGKRADVSASRTVEELESRETWLLERIRELESKVKTSK